MICLWKAKTLSLLYNLSLERKNCFAAVSSVFEKAKTFSLLYDCLLSTVIRDVSFLL